MAARLLGASASLRARHGTPQPPTREAAYRHAIDTVRIHLGEPGFASAFAAGQASTLEQIVADSTAMVTDNERGLDVVAPTAVPPRLNLTRREVDVLRLLVDGGSDQEIADALFVSRRTVTSHVTSILTKLQVPSRTAAATHAIRAQLI